MSNEPTYCPQCGERTYGGIMYIGHLFCSSKCTDTFIDGMFEVREVKRKLKELEEEIRRLKCGV